MKGIFSPDRTCFHCDGALESIYGGRRMCDACRRVHVELRDIAILAVTKAVRRGYLPPVRSLKCIDCAVQATDYDHRSYDYPLQVVPVCRKCNWKRGPATWKAA